MKNLSFLRYGVVVIFLLTGYLCPASPAYSMPLHAIQQQISGVVTDANGPLPGVTITVKDGSAMTISDLNGNYTITASPTDILIYTFIGYKTQEVPVQGRIVINATLQEDATALQEVTVNAGYYTVKDRERTGSIASIKAEDIEKQPVSNVLATMQGRMAGVDVTQDSGAPGGGFKIQIRGQNSLRAGGNDPLYVIDGVPYASETIGSNRTSTAMPATTSPLNSIDPTSIESIEVLKDADATAIYGSRGANGVVLITTKRGKAGKTRFTVNASTGVGKVTWFLDLMGTQEYLAMRRQAFENDGITTYPETAYDVNGTWDPDRYTDWQKELFGGTAEITNMQATVSGGSERTQFMLNGALRNETTVYPGDFRYKKGSVRFSMNHRSDNNRFTSSVVAGYTTQDNLQSAVDLTAVARSLAPNAPELYDSEGNLNWEDGTFENPVANLGMKFTSKTGDLTANTVLAYDIGKGFLVKSSFGFSDLRHQERRVIPSTIYNPSYGVGSESSQLYSADNNRQTWIAEPQLNYSGAWRKGKVDVLLGSTFQNHKTNKLVMMGRNFTSNALINNMASAAQHFVYGNEEIIYKYQAIFARANYNWDGRYILNVTGRRDGSSRFGPGRQFGNFGAIGAAWIFSGENFVKKHSWLSFGKLRGSYGTTGNDQIGDYQYLDTYSSTTANYQGVMGLQPIRLFNPNFGWEVNKKLEVAIESGFFKDRVFLSAAWYRNRSSNQLVGIPLPGTTGFATLNANLEATVENKGVELTLRTVNFQGEFKWTTDFNISRASNKLIEYKGLESSPFANRYVIGESVFIQKLFHYTGIDPETGLYTFEDVNGDGAITGPDDMQTVADLAPEFFGGLQNQFSYKGFTLDFLFQFVKQRNFEYAGGYAGGPYNQPAEIGGSWSQGNPGTQFQILTTGINDAAVQAYGNYTVSDASIVDGSYIRLKNLSLSYDLPESRTRQSQLRIFLQAHNALTVTKYKGDPEFNYSGYLPPLRIYSAGIQMTF